MNPIFNIKTTSS